MLSNKNAYSNKSSEGKFTRTTFIPMKCKFRGKLFRKSENIGFFMKLLKIYNRRVIIKEK